MNTEKTGKLIAELRKEKNLTQAELAEMINVSDKAVSRWETGRGFPDIDNLEALSGWLGITAAELLNGERLSDAEPITKDYLETISYDSLTLTRTLLSKRKYINIVLGFIISLAVLITAVTHLMSPIYIKDAGNAVSVEELSDGRIVATISENAAAYEMSVNVAPDENIKVAFISCYNTRLNQLIGKNNSSMVLIGNKDDVDEIYYYPSTGDDELLYKSDTSPGLSGGVITLPRLIYNNWLIIGIALTIISLVLYAANRKKYFAETILKIAALPFAFTVSIPLCLFGRFDEVYNAGFYFTGIILMTAALYALIRVLMAIKRR